MLAANYTVSFPASGIDTKGLGSEQPAKDTNFFGMSETMFYAVAGSIAFLLVAIIIMLVCCCCNDEDYGYNDGKHLSVCTVIYLFSRRSSAGLGGTVWTWGVHVGSTLLSFFFFSLFFPLFFAHVSRRIPARACRRPNQ